MNAGLNYLTNCQERPGLSESMELSSKEDVIEKLLGDSSVPREVLAQAGDPNLEEAILSELEAIFKERPLEDVGGTRVILSGRHISLGEVGWKLTTSSAALAISTLDPTGLTKLVALKEALGLLKELRPLLKKLDQGKLLVCSAVAAVSAEKKKRSITERGASRQDIEDYFRSRGESPPYAFGDILKSLESEKVLNLTYYQHLGPFYTIKF
jgi:hypothetical protein